MSSWPDPYPAVLAELWKRFGAAGPPPALPTPPAEAGGRGVDDPFWARAFAAFVGKRVKAEVIEEDADVFEAPPARVGDTAAPSSPPAAAGGSSGASDQASSESTSDERATEEPPHPGEVENPPAPDPPAAAGGLEAADEPSALAALASALDLVPPDARRDAWHDLSTALHSSTPAGDKLIRQALNFCEWLDKRAAVLPALEAAAAATLAAVCQYPGVTTAGDAEPEKAPAAAPPGTRVRLLRPGLTGKDGRVVMRPRALVSSRELAPARASIESFLALADAVEELAPKADPAAWHFLRKAPELIDTMAGGDPASPKALKLLRDCVGFATTFAWYHALPEFRTLCSGFDRVVDVIAAILRDANGTKLFPSAVQPFTDGKPAPAPFPQTVLKEVPDPAPRGTLLRLRTRGVLQDGKIEDEPVLIVSKGSEKFPALAKGLHRLAVEIRRVDQPWKKRTAFIDRAEKLLQDHVEAQDEKAEALALRFLINHLDEAATDGAGAGLRDAADALVEHLKERHGVRAQHVRAGGRADSSINPSDWEFQRQPGSGQPPDTILHVKKRSFRDASGQVVQRGVLVTS